MRWLRDFGLGLDNNVDSLLSFQPPPGDLWNPALNRSDWIPNDLLCDLNIASLKLPALPWTANVRMPFAPPAGLLRCLSDNTQLRTIDWSGARVFSPGMLAGLITTRFVALELDLESLYGGVVPVPFDFFSTLPASVSVSSGCGSSCGRIASRCPYFVDGACQLCPLGSFSRAQTSGAYSFAFCSTSVCALPGHYCNEATSNSSDPIPYASGSYQSHPNQGSCFVCPAGPIAAAATRARCDAATAG